MIRSNLSIILAETNTKITKVAHDTRMSRTTLTALAQNKCKGIQFDTLNTLCSYFKVSPSDLISFYPLDIKNIDLIEWKESPEDFLQGSGELYLDVIYRSIKYDFHALISGSVVAVEDAYTNNTIDLWTVTISNDTASEETKEAYDLLKQTPRQFLAIIENQIGEELHKIMKHSEDFETHINWKIFE